MKGTQMHRILILAVLSCFLCTAVAAQDLSQEMKDLSELFDQIDKNKDQHLSFLKDLIRASKGGEEAVQSVVAERFRSLGCDVETLRLLPTRLSLENEFAAEETIEMTERVSVVGKLEGTGGGRSLLFFGHPDGEPVTESEVKRWDRDPFAAVHEGGKIYGWGVADDLAGVAIMAEALDAVMQAFGRPKGDVYLGSTPAKKNARGILALLNEGYEADASVYLHPAESEAGLSDVKAITSGMLQFRITVDGRPPDTKEPGQTAFAHLAVSAVDKAALVIQTLKDLDAERSKRVHHPAMDAAVGRSTNLLIGSVVCGAEGRLTRVPTECVIGASITFPPTEELEPVQKEIEDSISRAAQSDPWLKDHPPALEWLFGTQGVEVPVDHPLYQITSTAIRDVTGRQPEVNPLHSASDIRNPALFRGIPTVGLGPLAGDFTQAGGHDEWVDVDDYVSAIKVCAKIIVDWCR
jgi:acetylornithine deacetylase